jgi:hypothetical protein
VDFDRLLKLRLVVARFGEMDMAKWWNTNGMLSERGEQVLKRGFPRTHLFVQARVVFSVARTRCHELFDPPDCMTLWSLPAGLEDQLEEHWQTWLDEIGKWSPVFQTIAALKGADLLEVLAQLDLISASHRESVRKLRRSAENRAVPLPGTHLPNDDVLTLLAAGFARGEVGSPAIPYARLQA